MELAVAAVIIGILIAVLRTPVHYRDSPAAQTRQPDRDALSGCEDPNVGTHHPQV